MPTRSDPDSLDEVMLRTGADIRPPLLRTLVDLYLQKPTHTAEEVQHFTELAVRLLEHADASMRAAVARRLASCPSVPPAIMQRLAVNVPKIAMPVKRAASGGRATPKQDWPARDFASPTELCELFFAAPSAERRLILVNLAYAGKAAAAVRGNHAGEAARQLEAAALAHNTDGFVRTLERWLGIAPVLARRIARDPLGEPIVVAAKVLGIAPDALQRILLFINPAVGRSVSRVYELAALFDEIDIEAAQVLLGIWRAADPQPSVNPARAPSDQADRNARRRMSVRTQVPRQHGLGRVQAAALTVPKR